MITETPLAKEILEAGYRYHYGKMYEDFKNTPHLFQKRVDDSLGKRYFINAWLYDFRKFKQVKDVSVQFEAQFKDHEGDALMNVQLFTDSVHEAEARFAKMWEGDEEIGYYEKWQDS